VAFERQNQIMVTDLEELVRLRIENLNKVKTQIRVREEMEFQSNILADDVALEDQLTYRASLIEKEEGKNIPDHDYISQLKADKSLLGKQIKTKNYREAYLVSLNDYKAKREAADTHLQFLNENLSTTNDVALRQEILGNVGEMESLIVQKHQDAVMFQIQNAMEDMTFSVLDDAIKLATKERNNSRMIADVDTAAMYDVKITVLNKAYRGAKIQNDLNKIDLDVKGGKGIDAKLNWVIAQKDKPSTGGAADPFSFDGVQYGNEQEFWGQYFTNFVAGEYFTAKETELKNKSTSLYNQYGDISNDNMKWLKDQTNSVFDNPALAPWKETLGKTFQQSVLMGALDYKMTVLQEELSLKDDPKGIASINQKIMDLQASVPEISQHSAFANLSAMYATKMRTSLQTKLENFKNDKTQTLDLLTNLINDSSLSQEEKEKAMVPISQQRVGLINMTKSLNFTDVPLDSFTFGKNPNEIYTQLLTPFAGLMSDPQVGGIDIPEYQKILLEGRQDIPIPTGEEGVGPGPGAGPGTGTTPPTETAAPTTPNVAGSANFEKELYLQGDEGKQQTMAGWGYKWDWSDQANQIGGWTPVSTKAKSKFKQTYGADYTGKKATLQKGDKKLISFTDGNYSKGLLDQGYTLI